MKVIKGIKSVRVTVDIEGAKPITLIFDRVKDFGMTTTRDQREAAPVKNVRTFRQLKTGSLSLLVKGRFQGA